MTISRTLCAAAAATAVFACTEGLHSQTAITYRFTFPEPQHHWMAVEASFTDLPAAPLELRMSRASPGRYSLHDFAKNVYDVQAKGADGKSLSLVRPDPYGWTIREHGPHVVVSYKVFGDRIDGTYLSVDTTHAHLNMPASIMWAKGLDDRGVHLQFVPPAGTRWQAATQLMPTADPLQFTAPNLQYLMDSPTELGPVSIRQFDVDRHTFRFALHHDGTETELDSFVNDVRRIVVAERDVYGEFPGYEPGTYTFIADYLPWASGDGMEHRNSTIITSSSAIRSNRAGLLGTVAHEFFHGWNVERIRPAALEPFDFERANMSGELWLAEGFTQYYGPLSMSRAGVASLRDTADDFTDLISSVVLQPGHEVRSAEEMSRMAAFTDGGRTIDRTNWSNTYISYYPFGGSIALALDLSLRQRTNGRVTLDDFMRAMWNAHGKPPAPRPGYVAKPYTIDDAERRLGEVAGDAAFARDFFNRYIHGRDLPDFATLLEPAGLLLRRRMPDTAWLGDLRMEGRGSVTLAETPRANTPAYKAGLDLGDSLRELDGSRLASSEDMTAVLRRHKPGDALTLQYTDRAGVARTTTIALAANPQLEIVPAESAGRTLTAAQTAFRTAWLAPKGN